MEESKGMIRQYYLQFCGGAFANVEEMEDFLAKYKLPKLTQKVQLTSYPRRNYQRDLSFKKVSGSGGFMNKHYLNFQ